MRRVFADCSVYAMNAARASAQSADMGDTFHRLEQEATRVITWFADTYAVSERGPDRKLRTRLHDRKTLAVLATTEFDEVTTPGTAKISGEAGSEPIAIDQAAAPRRTSDWVNRQVRQFWIDGQARRAKGRSGRPGLRQRPRTVPHGRCPSRPPSAPCPHRGGRGGVGGHRLPRRGGRRRKRPAPRTRRPIRRRARPSRPEWSPRAAARWASSAGTQRTCAHVGLPQRPPWSRRGIQSAGRLQVHADDGLGQRAGPGVPAPERAAAGPGPAALPAVMPAAGDLSVDPLAPHGPSGPEVTFQQDGCDGEADGCTGLHFLDGTIFEPCCTRHDECYETRQPRRIAAKRGVGCFPIRSGAARAATSRWCDASRRLAATPGTATTGTRRGAGETRASAATLLTGAISSAPRAAPAASMTALAGRNGRIALPEGQMSLALRLSRITLATALALFLFLPCGSAQAAAQPRVLVNEIALTNQAFGTPSAWPPVGPETDRCAQGGRPV